MKLAIVVYILVSAYGIYGYVNMEAGTFKVLYACIMVCGIAYMTWLLVDCLRQPKKKDEPEKKYLISNHGDIELGNN